MVCWYFYYYINLICWLVCCIYCIELLYSMNLGRANSHVLDTGAIAHVISNTCTFPTTSQTVCCEKGLFIWIEARTFKHLYVTSKHIFFLINGSDVVINLWLYLKWRYSNNKNNKMSCISMFWSTVSPFSSPLKCYVFMKLVLNF